MHVKRITPLFLLPGILILFGCNHLNFRNLGNENKWESKILVQPLRVHYDFDPVIIRGYGTDSYFLVDHVEDSAAIFKIDSVLQTKLSSRNFVLSGEPEFSLISVDSLFFEEYTEEVPVYDDEGGYVTDATYYDVRMSIHGTLNLDGEIKSLNAEYNFESEPRPGVIISYMTVHSNSKINMRKVIAILLNRFSYEAYQKAHTVGQ